MKIFNLESMGVHELSNDELKQIDGGFPLILAAVALIALVGTTSCISSPCKITPEDKNLEDSPEKRLDSETYNFDLH